MEPLLHLSDAHPRAAASGAPEAAELHYALEHDEERKRALYESGIVDEW